VQEADGMFSVTDSGRAATAVQVWLSYPEGERFYQAANEIIPHFSNLYSLKFQVSMVQAQELLIWVHRVTPEGQSESLPASLKVTSGNEIRDVQVDGVRQQVVLPLRAEEKKGSKGRSDKTGQIDVEVQLATAARQEK
jgi:hypothetical protein